MTCVFSSGGHATACGWSTETRHGLGTPTRIPRAWIHRDSKQTKRGATMALRLWHLVTADGAAITSIAPSDSTYRKSGQKPEGFWPLPISVLWRCPTLPQPGGCSTIGAAGLSFQVRNGGWAFPRCYDHHKFGVQHCFPAPCWWGCGLIVVCIVVAAVLQSVVLSPVCWVLFSVGPLVPVGSRAPRGASTSGLSTR